MLYDYPDGHGGSDTFVRLLRKWPTYGVAAQQGLRTLRRLLKDRGTPLVTMADIEPRITICGQSYNVSALDRYDTLARPS